jgi:hypothetical protein
MKCRRLQCVGLMARIGEARNACRTIRGSLLVNSHGEDRGDVTLKIQGWEVSG